LGEGEHRRRWEDNIKTNLKNFGNEDVDWVKLAQDMSQWQIL